MKYLFVVLLAVLCCLPGKAQQKKYKAYFVADAHLDTQWNWDLQTTISEYVLNTLGLSKKSDSPFCYCLFR